MEFMKVEYAITSKALRQVPENSSHSRNVSNLLLPTTKKLKVFSFETKKKKKSVFLIEKIYF